MPVGPLSLRLEIAHAVAERLEDVDRVGHGHREDTRHQGKLQLALRHPRQVLAFLGRKCVPVNVFPRLQACRVSLKREITLTAKTIIKPNITFLTESLMEWVRHQPSLFLLVSRLLRIRGM